MRIMSSGLILEAIKTSFLHRFLCYYQMFISVIHAFIPNLVYITRKSLFLESFSTKVSANPIDNVTTKKMADGTKRKYERDMYRCYRKLSSRKTCRGSSAYNAEKLNDAVDTEIRKHLARLGSISEEDFLKAACSQNADLYEVAYRQAERSSRKPPGR